MPSHIRQEVAFIFMAIFLLVLFSKQINLKLRNFLLIILGFSLIISHYATGYFFIFLLIGLSLILFFINLFSKKKLSTKRILNFSAILILVFLVFGFLWYSQVTSSSTGLIDVSSKSLSNFQDLFNEDLQMEGQSFADQFKLTAQSKNYFSLLNEEIQQEKNESLTTEVYGSSQGYSSTLISSEILPEKMSENISSAIYIFFNIIKKMGYVFIFIGLIFYFIQSKNKKNQNRFLLTLIGSIFLLFVVLITILPFGSIYYGTLRLYQQGLIILSLLAIIGANFIFSKLKINKNYILVTIFLILYFFAFSGFSNQLIGDNTAFSNLNNLGQSYETEYISISEINSISWLSDNEIGKTFYAGIENRNAIVSFGILPYPNWRIYPSALKKDSYVYAGNIEVYTGKTFTALSGSSIGYNFPTEFLNENKNIIYNNGGSEIFK
jgi:uncharacterized membrane protein